jgi:hypothetical protein
MKKYVYKTEIIAENREKADEFFQSGGEVYELDVEEEELSDDDLEYLWEALGDIPVNDDGEIEQPFLKWSVGTDREEIWHWFDEHHSEGVKNLMNLE